MAATAQRESSFCDENQNIDIVRALYAQKQSQTFCDVIMKVCGRDIYAHSNVLAAASPYFNTFLSQDLPRQFSQRAPQIIEIQIDGSEPNMLYEEAVSTVIDYIYTGSLTVNESNVSQVSEIARIMQIESVVKHCEDYVGGKVSVAGNVLRRLKGGIDAETSTEQSLLADLMTARQSGRSSNESRPKPHGKFFSLVSVSTQVFPKWLGLRESEKDMVDVGVGTERHITEFISSSMLHKPRNRGRPRKQPVVDPIEYIIEEVDPSADVPNGDEVEIQAVTSSEETVLLKVGETDESEVAEVQRTENVDLAHSLEVKKSKVETQSPRRSSRQVKPKYLDSEIYETEILVQRRKDGAKRNLFRAGESDKAETEKPSYTEEKSSEPPEELNPAAEEAGHSLIELAAAAAAQVEREKEQEAESLVAEELDEGEEKREEEEEEEEEDEGQEDEMEESVEDEETRMDVESEQDMHWHVGENPEHLEDEAVIIVQNSRVRRKRPRVKVEREYKYRPGGKYQCDHCHDFGTNSVRELGRHVRAHKLDQKVCYFCDTQFEDRDELLKHMDDHTGPTPFLCVHCGIQFKGRTQLNVHLPKHSDEKPFICEICSVGFKWKHALKNHMITHSNKKDHLCDICGYATAHKTQLKAHKRIHTGQTLKCEYPDCNFQSTKMQNLKYHMMTHTREKPHQCEVCGQAFSLKKNMKRHMLMHTIDTKRNCGECEFSSARMDKLKEHMLKQHGIGTPPEKRLKVSDLVAQHYANQQIFKTKDGVTPGVNSGLTQDALSSLGHPHVIESIDGEALDENIDNKTVERFIIEIDNEGNVTGTETGHLQLGPNQTIFVASGDQSLTGHSLEGITIAVPQGLDPAAVTANIAETTEVIDTQGLETIVTSSAAENSEHFSGVQYTEVMIPPEQVANLVHQVSYLPQ